MPDRRNASKGRWSRLYCQGVRERDSNNAVIPRTTVFYDVSRFTSAATLANNPNRIDYAALGRETYVIVPIDFTVDLSLDSFYYGEAGKAFLEWARGEEDPLFVLVTAAGGDPTATQREYYDDGTTGAPLRYMQVGGRVIPSAGVTPETSGLTSIAATFSHSDRQYEAKDRGLADNQRQMAYISYVDAKCLIQQADDVLGTFRPTEE